MKAIWRQLLISTARKQRISNGSELESGYSGFELARAHRLLKISIKRQLKDLILICAGIFTAAFGFKGFLLTNHFIDGGATGIALLLSAMMNLPLSYLIIAINIPFILLANTTMGRGFAVKTALSISGLAIVLATVSFPNVTDDNLLVAVFGGFFLGSGIGLAIRGGTVIDGTEVLAIYLSRKSGATIGDIIIAINIVIFSAAAYFLGVEKAMYSMITYLAASKTLDFIVEGIEEYMNVTIVSSHSEDIRLMIIGKMGRGVTVYSGKRGYGKRGEAKYTDILQTVVTRLEMNKLKTEIEKIDPTAFMVMNSVKDIKGGTIKKRPLDH